MAFADRLKELRQTRGLSQKELSKYTGLSKSAIAMYETGKREPNFETLETIADYFNVDINYLLAKNDGSTYYLPPKCAELAKKIYKKPSLSALITKYSALDNRGKAAVNATLDHEYEQVAANLKPKKKTS